MEKILATVYLVSVTIVALMFLAFYVSEWMDKLKKRKGVQNPPREDEPARVSKPAADILGKSTSVFFTPLPPAGMEPLMSDELEPEAPLFMEPEPEINPEDVETALNHPSIPDEDELEHYDDGNLDAPDELSQGLTFEQIGLALDVVEGRKSGETDAYLAGQAFSVMPDDFLNVICMQADRESMVKKLIDGYLNASGSTEATTMVICNIRNKHYLCARKYKLYQNISI